MCLIRKVKRNLAWAMAGCVLASMGCNNSRVQVVARIPPPEPVLNVPNKEDAAMQARQWPVTAAFYTSDVVRAWPRSWPLWPKKMRTRLEVFRETRLFLTNSLMFPFLIWVEPAWRMVDYKSISMPPTYTAVPPLPPIAQWTAGVPVAQTAIPTPTPTTEPSDNSGQ